MRAKNNKGFVLLYAVLATTVVLAVGIIITNIVIKQLLISSVGRNSQLAYYAADTGIECAFYWNIEEFAFGFIETGEFGPVLNTDDLPATVFCAGAEREVDRTSTNFNNLTSTFFVPIVNSGVDTCTEVVVTKDAAASAGQRTIIRSNGYNATCAQVESGNLPVRAVQRTVVSRS